jgi:hypothetical protein
MEVIEILVRDNKIYRMIDIYHLVNVIMGLRIMMLLEFRCRKVWARIKRPGLFEMKKGRRL